MNANIALQTVLGLMAIWCFTVYRWRNYRVDAFREHLFSIRDEMFLYAAEGHIGFEHRAYVLLRNRMNALIRYGHQINLITLIIALLIRNPGVSDGPFCEWQQAVASLSDEQQREIRDFSACVTEATLKHLLYSSFFLYLLTRPLLEFYRPPTMRKAISGNPNVVLTMARIEADAVEHGAFLDRAAAAA